MPTRRLRTDLVIPALNEASNIDALFDVLDTLGPDDVRHIVLADNGSTDDTAARAAARGAIVVHEPARGYGAACLRALAHLATLDPPPEIITFLDADLADDPRALPTLLAPIRAGDAEIAIGSRVRLAAPGALNLVQR
ncbi:MAG: glycosyltransferase family 2 protein, partial [Phycisphaerales bacterium]|nr:glycosyltransferase family 2 protein [Phycisphaerales bacterium]